MPPDYSRKFGIVCPRCHKLAGVPIQRVGTTTAFLCPSCNHRWMDDDQRAPADTSDPERSSPV